MAGTQSAAVDVPLFDFHKPARKARPSERETRRKGTKRAATHADEVRAGWLADAGGRLLTFGVFVNTAGPFLVEEARAWAERQGFAPPPDKRAWGAVPATLVAAKLLEAAGYGRAADGSPKTLWRLTVAGIKAAERPEGAPGQ